MPSSAPHVRGVCIFGLKNTGECTACAMGNSVQSPRKPKAIANRVALVPLDRVKTDVIGPMKHQSVGRPKHFEALFNRYSE